MKSLAFAKTYAEKCMTGLGQGMVRIFLEGAASEVEGKCDEASERHRLYLENAPCILNVGSKVHQCNKIIAAVLEVARDADIKQRIPQSCCFVSDYEDCVVSALSECGKGAMDYGKTVIEGYAGDLLHSVCRKWRHGSTQCRSLPKLKPHESPKYKTLLPPLVEVLQTLA
ncbi:uncharacterized protein LOC100908181 [Galendromus occidentalis]|uniref:Uncharacterized protein LOC100908181 n=1 Tax=Galendromus occidentalis TaxID=34638 RepID=A0AAJ6W0C7_9ACAR|nr:uncharacterized protein LOC100908181 [Galendromus occidentalis]